MKFALSTFRKRKAKLIVYREISGSVKFMKLALQSYCGLIGRLQCQYYTSRMLCKISTNIVPSIHARRDIGRQVEKYSCIFDPTATNDKRLCIHFHTMTIQGF